MRINHKAAINHTFNVCDDLTEVHVLPNGDHYFDRTTAEAALRKDEKLVTLDRDDKELTEKAEAKKA